MSEPPGRSPAERRSLIGDADRERFVTALREHYAAGRMDLEELRRRVGVVLVEFPSMERLREWSASPEYAEALQIRQTALARRLMFVEGVDDAGEEGGEEGEPGDLGESGGEGEADAL